MQMKLFSFLVLELAYKDTWKLSCQEMFPAGKEEGKLEISCPWWASVIPNARANYVVKISSKDDFPLLEIPEFCEGIL